MRKYFFIALLFQTCHDTVLSQNYDQHKIDSLKIDSLKKVMLTANDSVKVNCLTALCVVYVWDSLDSCMAFAKKAKAIASKINFRQGIAKSILYIGILESWKGNYDLAEKYIRQSLQLSQHLKDNEGIGAAWLYLGDIRRAQGYFKESIDLFAQSRPYLEKAGSPLHTGKSFDLAGLSYREMGKYEEAFDYQQKALSIKKKGNLVHVLPYSLLALGDLYKAIGDYETALSQYNQVVYYKRVNNIHIYGDMYVPKGVVFTLMHQYDSALFYLGGFIKKNPRDISGKLSLGELFLMQNKYDSAISYFMDPMPQLVKGNLRCELMRSLLDLGKAYAAKKDAGKAKAYARKGLQIANETGSVCFIRDGLNILSKAYDISGPVDSAYLYYRKYAEMKDTIITDQFKGRLLAYKAKTEDEKKIAQIELLSKENQLKENSLQREKTIRNITIGIMLSSLIIGLLVIRNIVLKKRKEQLQHSMSEADIQLENKRKEQKLAVLEKQKTDLEMQALRAQMNPHFIFNSLNSINRFILQNNKKQASEYLTKFSRLVRLILQNSQLALIPLESELEALLLYLELEAVRFDHHFEFNVIVDDKLDTDIIKVAPLIIQPYAENAIWHGLMHKEEKGYLKIELFQEDDNLYCKISDNGIGRKKAVELKSKSAFTHKSMGMQITASRIEMMQQKKQLDAFIKITDLVLTDGSAGGTEVLLKIPVCYD